MWQKQYLGFDETWCRSLCIRSADASFAWYRKIRCAGALRCAGSCESGRCYPDNPYAYGSPGQTFLPSLDEYKRFFRIDHNLLRYAKEDAIVMHPGPIQRGIEISDGVIDSPQCIINDQIANSVAVRMAMFYILSQMGGALA